MELPTQMTRHWAGSSETLDELYTSAVTAGKKMAEITISKGGLKKEILDNMARISKGEGFLGQEVPFGLLEREVDLPIAIKQKLIFFRGVKRGLAETGHQGH